MINTVAVIGVGVIGGAITNCLWESGKVKKVKATRRNLEALIPLADKGSNITDNNVVASHESDVVFLCTKPVDIDNVIVEINDEVNGKLVASTAGGTTIEGIYEIED